MLQMILDRMKKEFVDGLYITNPQNVRYVSGYTGADSFLLLTEDSKFFITDARYTEQAKNECPDFKIIDWRAEGKGMYKTINYILEKTKVKRLGFEAAHISYKEFADLFENIDVEITPVVGLIEKLRTIKTSNEIDCLREACKIADRAFNRILDDIKVGVTEKNLSAKLSYYLRLEGADAKSYDNIFISGKRTSLLHGIPSDKKIEFGDLVLMDFGASYNGYLSDMTRTVVVGKASEKQKEVYEIERKSQQDTINAIKARVSAKEPYYESLKVTEGTEYIKYHYTGIGHGIGLNIHEEPFMSPFSDNILEKNNVITVEPGIYIPGWGGVRIEDQVLVTEEGCEIMTSSTRELIIL